MGDRKEDYVASSFDQAFARARRAGSKTFKWANPKTGKMGEYSTKTAGEDASTPKSADSSTSTRSAMYSSPADTAKFRADRDKPRTGGGSPRTPSRGLTAFRNAYKVAQEEQTRAGKGVKEAEETTKRTTREMLADVPGMAAEAALTAAAPSAGRAILPRMGGLNSKAVEQALSRVPGRAVPNVTAKDLMRGQSTPEIGQGLVDRLREAARYSPETAAGLKKGGSVRPGKVKTVMHEFKSGKLKSSSGQKVTNPKQAIAIAMSEAGMKKAKKFAGKDGSYVGGMSDKEAKAYADTELRNQREMAKARAEELRQRKSEVERKAGKHMQSIRQSQEDSSFTTMPYKKGGDVKESKEMMKKEIGFMKRKGAPKSMIKHEEAEYGMKRGGKMKKFAAGGEIEGYADGGGINPAQSLSLPYPMYDADNAFKEYTAALTGLGAYNSPADQPNAFRQELAPQQRPLFSNPELKAYSQIKRNYLQFRKNFAGDQPKAYAAIRRATARLAPGANLNLDLQTTARNAVPPRHGNSTFVDARPVSKLPGRAVPPRLGNSTFVDARPVSKLPGRAVPSPGFKKGGAIAMKKGGGIDGIAKKGKTKTQHFAKGGSVSSRADGCATKGKTNCKMR